MIGGQNDEGLVASDQEVRIRDAALVLLDLCFVAAAPAASESTTAEQRQAMALDLAVQAVFMAEELRPGIAMARRGDMLGTRSVAAKAMGLGSGAGACLASFASQDGVRIASVAFQSAFNASFENRQAFIRSVR